VNLWAASMPRLLFALALLVAALYASAMPIGAVPALGPFLDPAGGVWALARTARLPARSEATIEGLTAPVEVELDDRGVPHIFAQTEEDGWRAQGYLLARDRLFQMELSTRAAGGTLTELVGARALDADRAARRRGLAWSAERLFAAADSGSLLSRAAAAYSEGVNAWIDRMRPADLPLEYRLLGVRPRRWEPVHTFHFFNQMALTLAYDDDTVLRLRVRSLVGAAATESLFPLNSPIQEPIQANGQAAPRYDFARPFPNPGHPDSTALRALAERTTLDRVLGLTSRPAGDGGAVGSNNWAVGAARTAAGYALLSGDPHLELTIPSIWYEVHLNVAGGPDVAGVTFPGAPGVIIGFNRNVAWSFTNTGADVRDHYVEMVDDSTSPRRYRLDGAWKPVERRVEFLRDPNGVILGTDTLYFTHRGPMVKDGVRWLSVRWTPFEARGGEDFLRLDRAGSVTEWLDGWKDFVAPAQNGIVADRVGTIAIRSTGRYPIRPGDGRGDTLRDGSSSASDWTGSLPLTEYPFSLNPPQGFLASANQQPVDPRVNPRYFGSNWISPWRAMRINQLLRGDSAVTPDAMRRYQTDPGSPRADAFVAAFLAAAASLGPLPIAAPEAGTIRRDTAPGRWRTPELAKATELLREWDRTYTRENRGAVLFENAMGALGPLVWDELIPAATASDTAPRLVAQPQDQVLLALLTDSTSAWWDNRSTPEAESRDDVLARALLLGYQRTVAQRGPPEGDGWIWSNAHHANIYHLLRLPALSALGLSVQGGPSTLSPSSGRGAHGASWRMVVELGPEVRAWGIFPGGQSGNPASAWYQDRVPRWAAGELDTLLFPRGPGQIRPERIRARLRLTGTASR
jgi:penicillin amidase